jgi:hypothetical protein
MVAPEMQLYDTIYINVTLCQHLYQCDIVSAFITMRHVSVRQKTGFATFLHATFKYNVPLVHVTCHNPIERP